MNAAKTKVRVFNLILAGVMLTGLYHCPQAMAVSATTTKSLSTNPNILNLQAGKTFLVKDIVAYTNGVINDGNSTIDVAAETRDIASYSNGIVTGLAPGTAKITINTGALSTDLTVHVFEATEGVVPASSYQKIPAVRLPGNVTHKSFIWEYKNVTYSWDVDIPNDLLERDTKLEEAMTTFYSYTNAAEQNKYFRLLPSEFQPLVLVTASYNKGNDTPLVGLLDNHSYAAILASKLYEQAQLNQYDRFTAAEFILSFVQALPKASNKFPKLAALSISGSTDCDDGSILLCNLLKSMDYDTALIYYSPSANKWSCGHMETGIAFTESEMPANSSDMRSVTSGGKSYYFCETLYPNYKLGSGRNDTTAPTAIYEQ
jgi:hypothetical protein